jgi:murein DD-endopeptidase MepM/ murein hydrolase activator NlpD
MEIYKPVEFGIISSGYGNRIRNFKSEFHPGIDIIVVGNPANVPVYASKSGIISYINYDPLKGGSFGRVIYIRLNDGFYSIYAHLDRISYDLRFNEDINSGDFLGFMGTSGISSAIHLHYEERKQMSMGNSRCPADIINLF